MALKLDIVTPDRVVLSTEADYVALPGVEGEFGVLPGHIPFFAALAVGCMHYQHNGRTIYA
ncbi:MAG: F0F1 ATP synthase subunit epsilon, partial [Deltaproteobacteria bacterium]|nr:F0F1 ATP synthase subunit epsilon [Deltaproteobacteria bacterium]